MKAADALPPGSPRRLAGAKDVGAERLHRVQPLDLHQAGQEVGDAVARRADSLEELQAVAHAADLVALQPEALGQMPPRLHHSCLAAVGGAQHATGLLQAVEGKLCGAQAWRGTKRLEVTYYRRQRHVTVGISLKIPIVHATMTAAAKIDTGFRHERT